MPASLTSDPATTAARLSELREAVAAANAEAAAALQRLAQSQQEGHRDPEALASYQHADSVMGAAQREASSLLALHHLHVPLEGRLASALEQAATALLALGAEVRSVEQNHLAGRRENAAARLSPLLGIEGSGAASADAEVLRSLAMAPSSPEELADWLELVPVLQRVVEHLEGTPLPASSYAEVARATNHSVLGALLTNSLHIAPTS